MNDIMDFAEGSSVINATIDPVHLRFVPEGVGKPTFIFTPEGADRLSVEMIRSVVTSAGKVSEITQKLEHRYERQLEVFGEQFVISNDGEGVSLFSPSWPLSGHGSNLVEAKADLIETINDLKDHYANTPIDQLDGRAVLFRDFILNSLNL